MDSNVRQERRRKIVERGGDRLALITGQVQTLSRSPSSPSPATQRQRHAHTGSSPSIVFATVDNAQINAGPEEKDDDSDSMFTKVSTMNKYPGARNFHKGNEAKPRSVKFLTNPDPLTKLQEQDSEITSSVQKASTHSNFFSSKQINTCIIASERTRVTCSLIIASLVIISYIDYQLFGFDIVSSESFIARPFYIILLTDVTIVLSQLFLENARDCDEVEKEINAAQEDEDNLAGAVNLLERGSGYTGT
ncbi:hypothetical protein MANES_04G123600v8 [Manihot esculenta]|uniref:Uncharacterized protein n=1 Tax=Manihot esculenta TaxID=3983 RepID=A0ACB7HZU6_MANES|nr:hypothetical protein MANES_04G123600v8 [Manihot esculenta]